MRLCVHDVLCDSSLLTAMTNVQLFLVLYLSGKRHRFCVLLWIREQREGGTKNWQDEREMGTSGVVVYLPSEEVTKEFSFICWLYWFICSINT